MRLADEREPVGTEPFLNPRKVLGDGDARDIEDAREHIERNPVRAEEEIVQQVANTLRRGGGHPRAQGVAAAAQPLRKALVVSDREGKPLAPALDLCDTGEVVVGPVDAVVHRARTHGETLGNLCRGSRAALAYEADELVVLGCHGMHLLLTTTVRRAPQCFHMQ